MLHSRFTMFLDFIALEPKFGLVKHGHHFGGNDFKGMHHQKFVKRGDGDRQNEIMFLNDGVSQASHKFY
jgi:hypothetical protein